LRDVIYVRTPNKKLLKFNFLDKNKKTNELVTDEKYGITFKVQLVLDGREIHEIVLSNPIVVIVHGNQETNALACIFWDNSFAQYDRVPFVVADSVKWKDFAYALSYKFYSGTGRELTQENLHFLAEKFYGHHIPEMNDDLMVSYSDFTKERLESREFTFWEWFYAAYKLTVDHLKSAWIDNCVIGFIDKRHAEKFLRDCVHGTFILRFSDSELGALSIAWLSRQIACSSEVIHILPIKHKEFEVTPLSKRIHQIENLVYLYPQTPKHESFRVDETPWSSNNYIRCITVMRVEMRQNDFNEFGF
jgi:signal transducer and activator of transcription 5B